MSRPNIAIAALVEFYSVALAQAEKDTAQAGQVIQSLTEQLDQAKAQARKTQALVATVLEWDLGTAAYDGNAVDSALLAAIAVFRGIPVQVSSDGHREG